MASLGTNGLELLLSLNHGEVQQIRSVGSGNIVNDIENRITGAAGLGGSTAAVIVPVLTAWLELQADWMDATDAGDGVTLHLPFPAILGAFVPAFVLLGAIYPEPVIMHWSQSPGAGRDIGVGANGSVWVVGTNPAPAGGFSIYVWKDTSWLGIAAGATQVSVDPNGHPWVVNSQGNIYQRSL